MSFIVYYIILSALIYVIFRLFKSYRVNTFQAIVVNYFVCAIMGIFFTGIGEFSEQLQLVRPALPYAIACGALFISVFTLIGKTTNYFGVAVTSISDKLSMIIPVIFAFIYFGQQLTLLKALGIVLSVIAVYLAVKPASNQELSIDSEEKKKHIYVPFLVFLGGGIISILLDQVQRNFEQINYNTFLVMLFGVAFLLGAVFLLYQLITKKTSFQSKSIVAGLTLGIPNYGTMVVLLKALNTSGLDSSVIFPVMNIGIVVLSSIIGIFIFKENSTRVNKLGLLLSIVAISLLLIERIYE